MTDPAICPLCDGPLEHLKDVTLHDNILVSSTGAVTLGPVEEGIVRCLLRWPAGATKESILIHAYGDREEPDTADKCVTVHLSKLRRKLTPIGFTIRTLGRSCPSPATYMFSKVESR